VKRKSIFALLVILVIPGLVFADGFEGRPITNNLFVPTGYTLHKGEFTVGIGPVAFGISENIQLETNILLWLFQIYNGGAKISLFKNDFNAFSAGVGLWSFNSDFADDDADGDVSVLGVGPYASYSQKIGPSTKLHLGARYSYFEIDDDRDLDELEVGAGSDGTAVFGGLEYSMSHRTKFVVDGGYDFDFEGGRFGGGVLFGWNMFRLKLGVAYYSAGDGFTLPYIGLWWRFKG